MNETNFADVFLSQMNNPECSMLAGMTVGNMMGISKVWILILIIIVSTLVSKGVADFYNYMKKRLTKN